MEAYPGEDVETFMEDEQDVPVSAVEKCEEVSVFTFARIVYAAAKEAEDEVNKAVFGEGKTPEKEWCGAGWHDNQTNGMRLGDRKHERAEAILAEKMKGKKLADGLEFKIEATYFCGKKKETVYRGIKAAEKNTIRPDIVVHRKGDPTFVEVLFYFKFTCPPTNEPKWGKNTTHDDYKGMTQGAIYSLILDPQGGCHLVNPHHGVSHDILEED